MTFNPTPIWFAEPNQVYLELSPTDLNTAWEQSSSFSHPSSRWNAYLNRICLNAILPWFQEEYDPQARIFPNIAALPSFWELVTGTTIQIDSARFVFIPSEATDLSELRVPQEWVDIPSLAADYYLGVQVNLDEGWITIWGYATHQQLKRQGSYNWRDRTYSLDENQLIADLNVLWVARQLCPDEPTKAEIAPLSVLPLEQAESLLERLGSSTVLVPRLGVPFELWGALIGHGGFRQRLYQRRIGQPETWSIVQWLQNGVSELAQQFGWKTLQMQSEFGGARSVETTPTLTLLTRELAIAGQAYELRLLQPDAEDATLWRFELRNRSPLGVIPGGFTLRLLTEDLQPFENNEDTAQAATDLLYVEVALEPGEGLVWEIEPIPENYDREILRF